MTKWLARVIGRFGPTLRQRLPRSLRGQFAIALCAMGLLVLAGGATAFLALDATGAATSRLSYERLAFMQSAQDLLELSQKIQWQAQRLSAADSDDEALQIYDEIERELESIDRLIAKLAVGTETSVLDLYQSSQLLRSSADVLAHLRRSSATSGAKDRLRLDALEKSREALLASAQDLVGAGREQSRVNGRAYEDELTRVISTAHISAYVVVVWLGLSLIAMWLIGRYFFGRLLLARLQEVSRGLRLAGRDGNPRPVIPVHGDDEVAEMARAVEQCLSERFQLVSARARLEEARQRLSAIIDNTADGIVVLQDDAIVQINPAAERMFGVRQLQIAGRTIAALLPEAALGALSPCGVSFETSALTSGGTEVPVEVSVSPITATSGSLSVLVVRDVTLRKETEQTLISARDAAEAARATQSRFLANVSHELRTPLHAVLGFAQVLLCDASLTARQALAAKTILNSGEHLLAVIVDLLDLAKCEAGKLELHPTQVLLVDFLHTTSDIVRVKAEEAGLDFRCEIAPDVPASILVDDKRLRQVLLNLLSNAVKFTDRGEVILSASVASQTPGSVGLRFVVRDTGIGMREDELEAIFQPFEQVGEAHRRSGGTGLGLAICRQLVRLMGSELQVTSEPNKGTSFAFELQAPLIQDAFASAAHAAPPHQAALGYTGPRKRILVADDMATNRLLLIDMLRPFGFEIEEARDGREAIDRARSFKPDLIIIDLAMPVVSGTQAIRYLRRMESLGKVPIIAVSADLNAPPTEPGSDTNGPDAFLAKPLDRDRVLSEVGSRLSLDWVPADPSSVSGRGSGDYVDMGAHGGD